MGECRQDSEEDCDKYPAYTDIANCISRQCWFKPERMLFVGKSFGCCFGNDFFLFIHLFLFFIFLRGQ